MVSVIIPTYNRADLIKRAIMSVLNQTYSDIEVLVVDDASTDQTEKIVKGIKDERLHYYKLETNGGACRARNIGISKAQGEFIAFLDSDDEWMSNKIELQYNFANEKNAIAVAANFIYKRESKKNIVVSKNHPDYFSTEELVVKNSITTGALFVKREMLLQMGGFDEDMPRYQDWELVLRLAKNCTIYFVKEPLLKIYFQEDSITNSTSKTKKYKALCLLYDKNRDLINSVPEAKAQFLWSMGLYSLYTDEPRSEYILESIKIDKFSMKKIVAYCGIKLGLKKYIMRLYGRHH